MGLGNSRTLGSQTRLALPAAPACPEACISNSTPWWVQPCLLTAKAPWASSRQAKAKQSELRIAGLGGRR